MKKILLFLTAIIALSSCETDLDIIGEYKDITVVYGLLNQNDTEHLLRIEKAFLGEASALVMAQNADSLYYDTTKITVKLVDSDDAEILFTPILVEKKDSGGFYYGEKEILYRSTATLNASKEYTLVISKASDTDEVTATTPLIKNFSITKPSASGGFINFLISPDNYSPYNVLYNSAENGIDHRVTVRFYYREYLTSNPANKELKWIDWVQPVYVASDAEGGEPIQLNLNGEDFFRFLKNNIDINPNVERLIGKGDFWEGTPDVSNATDHLEFIFNVGGEELYNYIELNKPSLGVAQDKPVYTNIDNGLGIFSCRTEKIVPNKTFNIPSVNELKGGQYTADLNFVQETD